MSQMAENPDTFAGGKNDTSPRWERRGTSVSLRSLRRSFDGTRALDDLSIDINPGELVVLLGPSGCGKTTALRALAGLEPLDGGSVHLGDRDVTNVGAHKRGMGMVFQAYSLFPNMTAAQNVAYGLKRRRMPAKAIETRVSEMLSLVRLSDQASRYATQLSGGQQQRVALARALAISPEVLLLDEPLSALDAKVRLELREEIRRIQLEFGITTLFVTHDQDEALAIADRIAVLNAGRIEQIGTPSEIYSHPANSFVAEFVGSVNIFTSTVQANQTAVVLGQTLDVTRWNFRSTGTTIRLLVRPEAISIYPAPDGNVVVSSVGFMGSSLSVTAMTQNGDIVRSTMSWHGGSDLRPGVRATAEIVGPVLYAEQISN